jgi:hypothetical protein
MAIIWREHLESSSDIGAILEAVAAWSKDHTLELPAALTVALLVQNGGMIADCDLRVYPLGDFKSVNDADWSDIQACNETKPSVQSRLIEFAEDVESYQRFFLDFASGLESSAPSIWGYWRDTWSIERVAASLEEFIEAERSRKILSEPSDETVSRNLPQDVGRKPTASKAAYIQRLKVEAASRYVALKPQQQEKVRQLLKKNEFQIMSGNSVISTDMEPEVANVIEWMSQLMRKSAYI